MLNQERQLGIITLVVSVFVVCNVSAAQQLVVGVNEYHRNLNPVKARKNIEKNITSLIYEAPLKFNDMTTRHDFDLCTYERESGYVHLYPREPGKIVFHDGYRDIGESILYSVRELARQGSPYGHYFGDPVKSGNKVTLPVIDTQGIAMDEFMMTFPVLRNGSLKKGAGHFYHGGGDVKANMIVGTGPFKLVGDDLAGKTVTLERFGSYRKDWTGNLERVVFNERDALSVLIDSLLQTDRTHGNYIDVLPGLYLEHTNTVLEKRLEMRTAGVAAPVEKALCYAVTQPSRHFYYIGFNYKKAKQKSRIPWMKNPCKYFNEYNFRRFVAKAFDKEKFFENNIGTGGGELLHTPYKIWNADMEAELDTYKYLASMASDEYGKKGLKYEFGYFIGDPVARKLAVSFQEAMARVGVKIKLKEVNLLSAWKRKIQQGHFDIIYTSHEYGYGRNMSGFLSPDSKDNILGVTPSTNIKTISRRIGRESDLNQIEMEKNMLASAMNKECTVVFLWSMKKSTAFRTEVDTAARGTTRLLFDNIHQWRIDQIDWIR